MSGWRSYGRIVAGPDAATSERLELRLRDAGAAAARRRGPGRLPALVAALAIAAALLLWLAWPRSTPSTEPIGGAVRIATTDRAQEVALPRAGILVVDRGSIVELEASETTGARVRLHAGAVTLDVQRHEGARWIVEVDDFHAEALGTRFHVRRTEAAPEVSVDEGVVRLSGPGLPPEGVRLEAHAPPATRTAAAVDSRREPADESVAPEIDTAPPEPEPAIPEVEPVAREATPAWLGRFRDAIDRGDPGTAVAALPESFPSGREALSAADFLDAGDALASRREHARAERAYRAACRRRSAGACAVATFRLAIMRSRAGDHTEAIALASRYLEDHPRGSLAREVLGRRMQWRFAHEPIAAAKADAIVYLERWPDGPNAELARRIRDAAP